MSVDFNSKIAMKPGFGKKLENPTFAKQSLSSTKSADSSVFNKTTSLKSSASQSLATTTLNRSYSAGQASGVSIFGQKSANWQPGNHFMGVSDFYRDRHDVRNGINTTGIGYDSQTKGYRSGKHDMELMTGGWTQRSEDRAYKRMGMVDLTELQDTSEGSGKKKMSLLAKIGIGLGAAAAIGGGIYALSKIGKKENDKKSEGETNELNNLAQNNPEKTVEQNDTPQTETDPVQELQSQISETNSKIATSKSKVSNCQTALTSAKLQLSQLERNADKDDPIIQQQLESAKQNVETKQELYTKALDETTALQMKLTTLNNQLTSLTAETDKVDGENPAELPKNAETAVTENEAAESTEETEISVAENETAETVENSENENPEVKEQVEEEA